MSPPDIKLTANRDRAGCPVLTFVDEIAA